MHLSKAERLEQKKIELYNCNKAKWGRAHTLNRPASLVGSPLVRSLWPGSTQGTPQRQLVKDHIYMFGKWVRVRYEHTL